jgi:DNA-directed RNA polymerase subunit H (RpoH/RPB5)
MELESFAAKELETPIVNHRLQPKSFKSVNPTILGKVKPSMLPKMYESDPIAKYFHFVKGDVVEIERKNGIVVYREVIEE